MTPLPRSLVVATAALKRAVAEARLAYQFSQSSYTSGCLSACLAAEQAVAVLHAVLEEQFEGEGG
ncbi:hypothetical protein [Bradyrhizobium sp. URHC0002]